jgi:hypothetical protein
VVLVGSARWSYDGKAVPVSRKAAALPAWILWLSPVIVAPLIAVFWIAWYSRPRGPVEAMQSVQQHDRFRAALTQPLPEPRRARREGAHVSP